MQGKPIRRKITGANDWFVFGSSRPRATIGHAGIDIHGMSRIPA